jgi:RNA polymerase sigma factor (sigma-70 family)
MPSGLESWQSTLTLLNQARAGDPSALERLFERYLPWLQRWATGRLPVWARDMTDTHDLVQDTLLSTFRKIGGFEHRGEGALQAYLRQALMNRVRDELRRAGRRPAPASLHEDLRDAGPTPMEQAADEEVQRRYESALARLTPNDRELVVARIDLGLGYREIAEVAGRPSADAVRMALARALVKLAEAMDRE